MHPSTAGRTYVDIESCPFQIPLGALIPIRVDNLLAAGKNLGTTHVTNGCHRNRAGCVHADRGRDRARVRGSRPADLTPLLLAAIQPSAGPYVGGAVRRLRRGGGRRRPGWPISAATESSPPPPTSPTCSGCPWPAPPCSPTGDTSSAVVRCYPPTRQRRERDPLSVGPRTLRNLVQRPTVGTANAA
ncbi:FAD-dependent oxidoreductase [Micromonospora yasonensis]|nr:FAD-dependent oxidoreductase [Micromonospora yasonensis]